MAESVTEFFEHQNVFITGGTGFLGRVLIEKLLRSCPNIGKIYVLMREKKGLKLDKRVEEIINLPLFELLRGQNPENLKKITPVPGDFMKLNLGLSENDNKMLEENVSIVFNCAASVRFDDSLKKAIILNTRGTREAMLLARRIKNLKAFVHTSTCYCQCDKKVVEEKFYPAPVDWRKFIEIAETTDEEILNILTYKIIFKLPNTYVFSKALSEHVIKDLGENLPVVIIRPSVVISTWNDPYPGWIDNWNGPVALVVAGMKGIIRTFIIGRNKKCILDMIPVDFTIKVMCVAAWDVSKSRKHEELPVYNVSVLEHFSRTFYEMLQMGLTYIAKNPIECIWPPAVVVTDIQAIFTLYVICFQVIPSIFLDFGLKLRGMQPVLLKIQRKSYHAMIVLSYFFCNIWTFKNDNMMSLGSKVPVSDEAFNILEIKKLDIEEYICACINEGTHFLLNTTPGNPRARRILARMLLIKKMLNVSASVLGLWAMYYSGFIQNFYNYLIDTVHSLTIEF